MAARPAVRSFTTTGPALVRVGDSVPDMTVLAEGSPGNKVNMAEEIGSGKALIIGVPAAFSKSSNLLHGSPYLLAVHAASEKASHTSSGEESLECTRLMFWESITSHMSSNKFPMSPSYTHLRYKIQQ